MLRGAYIPVWSKRTARCIVVTYWPPRRQFRRASFSSHRSLPARGVQSSAAQLTLVGLLALAMGGQNAVVRRLAVPDLTTTVLTLTVTGLVADTTSPSVRVRRLLSVVAMLAGALTGGVLLHWVAVAAPLWLAAVLLAVCAAGAFIAAGGPRSQAWR
jgi:uncharacterized membrane protein YoaK (UPF0700 family)